MTFGSLCQSERPYFWHSHNLCDDSKCTIVLTQQHKKFEFEWIQMEKYCAKNVLFSWNKIYSKKWILNLSSQTIVFVLKQSQPILSKCE